MSAPFHTLKIGETFHLGQHYGMGIMRNVLSWTVYRKTDKTHAQVVSNHGNANRTGENRFDAQTRVIPVKE